jgi:hypothetical protein
VGAKKIKIIFTVQIDCTVGFEICVMEKEMKEIIKRGYDLFACHKLNGKLDVCSCCVSEEEQKQLLSVPVEKIPSDLLSVYNTSAMPEKIDVVEYKYFLPRILELISEFNFPAHSIEITLNRMAYLKPGEWSTEEAAFLEKYMKSFFKKCLTKYPSSDFEDLEAVIIMLSKTGFDISWTSKIWEEAKEFGALMHFVQTIASGVKMTRKGNLSIDNPFADDGIEFLNEWLNDKATILKFKSRIEELLVIQSYTGAFVKEINEVYETLNCLGK